MGRRGDRGRRIPAVQQQKLGFFEIEGIKLTRVGQRIKQQQIYAVEFGFFDEVLKIKSSGLGWKIARAEKREKDGEQIGVSVDEPGAKLSWVSEAGEEGTGTS